MRAAPVCVTLALAAASLLSCSRGSAAEGSGRDTCVADTPEDPESREALEWADSVLADMTLEERIGQLFMPSIYTSSDPATVSRLRGYVADMHVGGIVLLRGSLSEAAEIAAILGTVTPPLFVAMDAEWGLGMRLDDAPVFPRYGAIGSGADERLMYDYGKEMARECRLAGVNMLLGPVLDVVDSSRPGPIGSRSLGDDPSKVAGLAVAYARGAEEGGLITVAKHFPGHGASGGDTHLGMQTLSRSLSQLDSIDLLPFRRYCEAGLSAVMIGHLAVPAVDPESRPAAVSPVVIRDLLRNDLGFGGLIITDAMNMGGAGGYTSIDALEAGADMVIAPADTRREIREVRDAVISGRFSRREIDDRCRRVLARKRMASGKSIPAAARDRIGTEVGSAEARDIRRRLDSAAAVQPRRPDSR